MCKTGKEEQLQKAIKSEIKQYTELCCSKVLEILGPAASGTVQGAETASTFLCGSLFP